MSEEDLDILKLSSVPLTREKQIVVEAEFEKYAAATNFTIKAILQRKLTSHTRAVEVLLDDFIEKFDQRENYRKDVVKTARVEIGRHKRQAQTIRSMREKTPFFKSGRMIFSIPIIGLGEKAIVLAGSDGTSIPIPLDKRSRNKEADILNELRKGTRGFGRIRLTWNREGYLDIDIRVERKRK
ncbi:MAG: hypothetical protein ACW97A_06270 [Candidatus Thorarchaeota archaeon]|jgi:hypothetical protein